MKVYVCLEEIVDVENYGEYFEDEDGNRVVIKDNYISINIDKDIFNGLHTFWVDVVETED